MTEIDQGISCQNNNLKSISSDYIYQKFHKKSKGKPPKKDSPLLKNDIPNNLWPQKPAVYSSYMKSGLSA